MSGIQLCQVSKCVSFMTSQLVNWLIPNLETSLRLTKPTYLPEKGNIKKMADKERSRANPTPGHPKTIDEIDMPDDCRKILKNAQDDKGRLFLQHECSKNAKQIFFSLARMRMCRYICRSDTAYALRRKFNEAEIL